VNQFAAPRKSLGQNFLQDPNIINKIVSALNVQNDDTIIEIGPGRGALTELILPLAGQLHLVEFDRDLVRYWQQRSESQGSLAVHAQDVLKFDLQCILSSVDGPIKVIGNLPYNISSPVLFHLMQYADALKAQVVMLQKEVIERMVATPGNKQYGRMSVMLQQRYAIEHLFNVPATAFFPAPKVESAIARLTPLTKSASYDVTDHADFSSIVKQAFSQRRKTLRNTLKGFVDFEQIESLDIDPSARAETLGIVDFCKLADCYTNARRNDDRGKDACNNKDPKHNAK